MSFRRLEINEKRCEYFIDCMRNARYPERGEQSKNVNEPSQPIHDWSAHFRTSYEYWIDNEPFREDTKSPFSEKVRPDGVNEQGFIVDPQAAKKDWRYN